MSPQDLYGVLIRTCGLMVAIYGAYTFLYAMAVFCSPRSTAAKEEKSGAASDHVTGGQYLFAAISLMLLGSAVISLADEIVRMSY